MEGPRWEEVPRDSEPWRWAAPPPPPPPVPAPVPAPDPAPGPAPAPGPVPAFEPGVVPHRHHPSRGRRRRARQPGPGAAPDPHQTIEAIQAFGTPAVVPYRNNIHCVTIIGQIEGHMVLPPHNKTTKYEHVLPQLVAVEQSPEIEGLLVLLNTVGGDVEAGLAIAEVLASISKPTVSVVLGGGHSIGVPIAVSCDYAFIAATATMTIHPIRMSGVVIGVPQSCEYLAKMQDRVVHFVVQNSRITESRYRELMLRTGELARDVGTILVGPDAVKEGLIDAVGGVDHATRTLREMIAARRDQARGENGAVHHPFHR